MSDSFDLGIVGAGPGGYVAAIRAAQLGMKVALIEKDPRLGGTCLNIGCIPSKALLDTSALYGKLKQHGVAPGIEVPEVKLDLASLQAGKDSIVSKLTGGIETLMKKNGVTVYHGTGVIEGPGKIRVLPAEGAIDARERSVDAGSILLATGSIPVELPFLPFDGETVVSSAEALAFEKVPDHLAIVGGGVIGLELGSVWSRLGAQVTVIELLDTILPGWDLQISRTLKRILEHQGLEFHLSTKVTGIEKKRGAVSLKAEGKDGKAQSFEPDKVLVAVGRRPYHSQNLGALGIKLDGNRVVVDKRFATSVPGIYAIGDLIAGPMLAHKAEEEGIACVELLAGRAGHVDYAIIPGVVYTHPEAVSVGSTEEQLKEAGIAYSKGSFPFRVNGRALASGETEGFVKILADSKTDTILGAHIVGSQASALIAEVVAVMAFRGSAEDIGRTVHAHPTLPEVVKEAALAAGEGAIHI